MPEITAILMAAGHGTRMKSPLPKVVHPACGRPLVYYPTRAALDAGAARVVVVVNPSTHAVIEAELRKHLPDAPLVFAVQEVPRGTGDAVRVGLGALELPDDDVVLVLSGDTPLLAGADLRAPLAAVEAGELLSFLSFRIDDPTGYGRVLRSAAGRPREIREHKDLQSDAERAITEVNAGVYAGRAGPLREAVAALEPNNAQGELYLTDVVRLLADRGALSARLTSPESTLGVNHRGELNRVEEILFERIRKAWGERGVSVVGRPSIDDTVTLAPDVIVEDGVRLRGATQVGAGSKLDVGVVVDDSIIGERAFVKPYSVVTQSRVGDEVQLGPFAHLRPGSQVERAAHVGNFVELKNTRLGPGAKANHLAYLGDADVGEGSNLGAGTIVCNYDGFRKSRTTIGARVFVGSDSQLVAPITIGDEAYVATGTTVTEDVPPGALAVGRVRQENKPGYAEPLREKLRARAAEEKARRERKE